MNEQKYMKNEEFLRTEMVLGSDALARLRQCHVAVFGLGGVGSYAAEALCRAGVGELTLIDGDVISPSNINRQLYALHSTIGQPKAEVAARRVADINPDCTVRAIRMFYLPQNADTVDLGQYDYVVDCIDTVAAKLDIAQRCARLNVPLISAMGTGNKLDPTGFVITDISKTQGCPLARVMRKELRKRGVNHLKVVYSKEEPLSPAQPIQTEAPAGQDTRPGSTARRATPGSISFVPAAAGLVLASAVVRDIGGF